ncbi:MAG: leucine-rich repeat domain-containing protein [Clostridia bacterium]|nr:leucine-rich repeat domain-containing protein [Clostridia bacterium]
MSITVLKLLEGDQYGRSEAKDYKLEPEVIEGAAEAALMAEIACWGLQIVRVEVYEHEEYGKWEDEVFRGVTPFSEAIDKCIVCGGRLAGIAYGSKLIFLPLGTVAKGTSNVMWSDTSDRSEEYCTETLTLVQYSPSPRSVYYDEQDGNPTHTVVGVDPRAAEVEIAPGTRRILRHAFDDCTRITSVHIPASVDEIEPACFSCRATLEKITVAPENPVYRSVGNCLIDVNTKALVSGCKTSVIPEGEGISAIEFQAFAGCHFIDSVAIPEGVTLLGQCAFYDAKFKNIVIPRSLEEIDINAFGYCECTGGVYYRGTREEWEKIKIARMNSNYLLRHPRYYYSESKPDTDGSFWHYGEADEILVW